MTGEGITAALATSGLTWAINVGFALLLFGALLTLWRAARGPLMSDRLIALAHSWLIGIGLIVLLTLRSHNWRMLDLALALALLGGVVPLAWSWANRRRPQDPNQEAGSEGTHVDAH